MYLLPPSNESRNKELGCRHSVWFYSILRSLCQITVLSYAGKIYLSYVIYNVL